MSAPRITLTGATGLIGTRLVGALQRRGVQVTVLTRDPARARETLGEVEAILWRAEQEPAPVEALAGRDALVHLAGAPLAQRWSASVKRAIRESRVNGTRNLLAGVRGAGESERPGVLISASAIGYYGARGEEPLDEDARPGDDFLAQVCVAWEAEALAARGLGLRVVPVRTGVVLDRRGGALAKMLPAFRLGVGGPLAGGRQYISWIHAEDVVGMVLAALADERWSEPVNATAPEPLSNRDFSRALGAALGRPALMPVPALALRARFGEMAGIVTTGARVMPARALVLGYEFRHPHLQPALRAALAGE